jgi:hypothetical protein
MKRNKGINPIHVVASIPNEPSMLELAIVAGLPFERPLKV